MMYLIKTPEPVGQQGRWLNFLGEYDITVQHRPRRVHTNSDALSRRLCEWDGETDCRQCGTRSEKKQTTGATPVSRAADAHSEDSAKGKEEESQH